MAKPKPGSVRENKNMSKRDDFEVIDLNDASSEGGKKISGPKARRKSNSKIEVEKVDIKNNRRSGRKKDKKDSAKVD